MHWDNLGGLLDVRTMKNQAACVEWGGKMQRDTQRDLWVGAKRGRAGGQTTTGAYGGGAPPPA